MNDSQASLIELADQLFTAYCGLPPYLRADEFAGVVARQCLEIYAPYATPVDREKALLAALEHKAEEMAA